jgi:hypothetical protein
MNPLAQTAIFSLLRWVLAIWAGYLVNAGVWDASAAETYVVAAAMALISLGWSAWSRYHDRVKLMVALMLPNGSTEKDVNAKVAIGHVPSVMTAVDQPPTLPSVVA